jgi:hypothetical protein
MNQPIRPPTQLLRPGRIGAAERVDLLPQALALELLAQLGRDRALLDIVDEALVSGGLLEPLLGAQLEVVQDHRDVDAELDRGVPLRAV